MNRLIGWIMLTEWIMKEKYVKYITIDLREVE